MKGSDLGFWLVGVFGRAVLAVLLSLLLPGKAVPAEAQNPHRVGLVVVFEGGRVETRCVEFSETRVSGTEVLERSGLQVVFHRTPGLGAAICAIEGLGCQFPAEDCFCRCRGAECRYWNYWRFQDGVWLYSGLGASNRFPEDGDLEAWVWSDGKSPPPLLSFEEVCLSAEGETSSPTTMPTASPTLETAQTPAPTASRVAGGPSPTLTTPARAGAKQPGPTRTPTLATPATRPRSIPTPGPITSTMALAVSPSPIVLTEPAPLAGASPEPETGLGQLAVFGGMVAFLLTILILAVVRSRRVR
ncbi:MAG: hypothetical protein ACUVXG_04675 [Anaerolineae bacterium]